MFTTELTSLFANFFGASKYWTSSTGKYLAISCNSFWHSAVSGKCPWRRSPKEYPVKKKRLSSLFKEGRTKRCVDDSFVDLHSSSCHPVPLRICSSKNMGFFCFLPIAFLFDTEQRCSDGNRNLLFSVSLKMTPSNSVRWKSLDWNWSAVSLHEL